MIAQINSKVKELRLLEEALCIVDTGGDIYKMNTDPPYNNINTTISKIADECTAFLLSNELEHCYEFFTKQLSAYMPLSVFVKVWSDTTATIGKFILIKKKSIENNIILHHLRFEKLFVVVKYVFNDNKISGIWLNYCE